MEFDLRTAGKSLFASLILCPLVVVGQTLSFTNGIETYTGLTNATVNLNGHAELHLTGGSNPMPGCQINLNSPDAWFFLDNIAPATAASGYLGRIKVNGAAAVQNGNVRVVEYGMGTVVIAQSPSYLPLEVFSVNQFTGNSMKLGLCTYYNSGNLGALKARHQFVQIPLRNLYGGILRCGMQPACVVKAGRETRRLRQCCRLG